MLLTKICPTTTCILVANYFIDYTAHRVGWEEPHVLAIKIKICHQYPLSDYKHTYLMLVNSSTMFKTNLC